MFVAGRQEVSNEEEDPRRNISEQPNRGWSVVAPRRGGVLSLFAILGYLGCSQLTVSAPRSLLLGAADELLFSCSIQEMFHSGISFCSKHGSTHQTAKTVGVSNKTH